MINIRPQKSQWKSDATNSDSVKSAEAYRLNIFGPIEKQAGGHII